MTTLHFSLYHRGELLTVRAELHDDALRWDGGGAAHVEQVETYAYVPPKVRTTPLSRPDELRACCALDSILRVAAAYCHRPWDMVTAWPEWADPVEAVPMDDEFALWDALHSWDAWQYEQAQDDDQPLRRGPDYSGAPPPWR